MFNEMEKIEMKESVEQTALGEDQESAVLENGVDTGAVEGAALTEQEVAILDDCAEVSAQQVLEQYALDDEGILAALEDHAAVTETKEDDGQTSLRIEGGSSCGSGRGCSGSTWCYGCGDLK